MSDADWEAATALLADAEAALAPLRRLGADAPLAEFLVAHRAALAGLANQDGDWRDANGGQALDALFDEWRDAVDPGFRCSLADYAALFDAVAAAERAPPARPSHPRLQILGLLEARLLSFDLALIAGLDETVWPPAAETDAFLNRSMRASLGLSPPERRIGQTAHDFAAALGAPRAIVSRARKRGGAPTVASRFLQRIEAVAGKAASDAAKTRGAAYLALARALDQPTAYLPRRRPEPKPPLALRPASLSVTRIETLRRDPYAIYAERILDLHPLEPIGPLIGARRIRRAVARSPASLWRNLLRRCDAGGGAGAPAGAGGDDFRRAACRSELSGHAVAAHCRRNSTPFSPSTPSGAGGLSAFWSNAKASLPSRWPTDPNSR